MKSAITYNKTNNVQYDTNLLVVQRFFSMLNWKNKEKIIDIGMGDGKFTANGLLPKLPQDLEMLIGCDIVPANVNFAQNNYSNSKLKFIELDIGTKNLREDFLETFDHVFSFFALHWVNDLRHAFQNIYDMMKPGAEFFIVMVEENVDQAFYNLSKYPRWAPYGHEDYISSFFNRDGSLVSRRILEETGFTNLNCFREYNVYRHKNKETCDEMFKSINLVAKRIPKEDLDDYNRDFIKELYRSGLCRSAIDPETQEELITSHFVTIILFGKKPERL